MKAKGDQPDHSRQVDAFYSDSQIQGRRPGAGKGIMRNSENVNAYDTPANGRLVRKGYSSAYPNRSHDGKRG